jgi:hypothetical protein
MVTIPLGVTRATMLNPMPVFALATVLVTAPVMPLAVCPARVGTVAPTLMLAGILSVAITAGAERTLARLCDSCNVTVASNSRLLPTSAEPVRVVVSAIRLPKNEWDVVPSSACSLALTPLPNWCVKSTE